MNQHPHIQVLHQLFLSETQPFRKVHRMIDLFESLIKFHTVVILSEYVKHNKLSDNAKFLLARGLYLPTLGVWKQIGSTLFKELEEQKYSWLLPDFPIEFNKLDKALEQKETNVIALRNYYGHGATPNDDHCEKDIQKFYPFLNQLLWFNWIKHSSILIRENKVFLTTKQGELSLHPILLFRDEKFPASLAFFNDLKSDKIGLLNYPLSKYYREKSFYDEFQNYFPLRIWKKSSQNLFDQQIEELTESFKGREDDLEVLKGFVRKKNKGYLSVLGNPGIGKSTLIAQFIKELRTDQDLKHVQVIDYFIHRGRNESRPETLLNYLIQKTDETFKKGQNIRPEKNGIWHLQEILFEKWRLWSEHSKEKKLLILIDGLDEGVENNLIGYLPRENFENVLMIYGSRPGGHPEIIDFWPTLPVEHHTKLELGGLSKEDIRALIYEVGNKYEIERESKWIDTVLERSNGYPLYIKLLCDAIENGRISLNDINALPKEINNYYEAILRRYSKDKYGNALLSSLFTLAAAKDELSISHLRLINQLDYLSQEHVSSTLREILTKNEKSEVDTYRLFHETFRDFLIEKRKLEIEEAEERVIDFCATWEDLEGTYEQRYALQHYAAHLIESKKSKRKEELLQLLNNKPYIQTQKQVLRQFESTKTLLQIGLAEACEQKNWEIQLETALSLVDLKYEEANEAPKIIEMVANGEIDLALKRIESFGGQDEEGLKRKFILYMLCLAELTLLYSREKEFRIEAISAILEHFGSHIPVDTSLINWSDFFPDYFVFLMACEWEKLGLNYLNVYRITDKWENSWIHQKAPYNKTQLFVLLKMANVLKHENFKNLAYKEISLIYAKQGEFKNAIQIADKTTSNYSKNQTYSKITKELASKGEINQSLKLARSITEPKIRIYALCTISSELLKKEKNKESNLIIQEAKEIIFDKEKESLDVASMTDIPVELARNGEVNEALKIAQKIENKFLKCCAFSYLSTELSNQGKEVESLFSHLEAINTIQDMKDEHWIARGLSVVSIQLTKQKKLDKALNIIKEFKFDKDRCSTLRKISKELLNQGKKVEAEIILKQAVNTARILDNLTDKFFEFTFLAKSFIIHDQINIASKIINEIPKEQRSKPLVELAIELARNRKKQEAIETLSKIKDEWGKNFALKEIANEFTKNGEFIDAKNLIIKGLIFKRRVTSKYWKEKELEAVSSKLANQGNFNSALNIASFIKKEPFKTNSLIAVSTEFLKKGKLKESINVSYEVNSNYWKDRMFLKIAIEFIKQSDISKGLGVINKINEESDRILGLIIISNQISKGGNLILSDSILKKALEEAYNIDNKLSKANLLLNIFSELSNNGNIEKSNSILIEAIKTIREIEDEYLKSSLLKVTFSKYTEQEKLDEAMECINEAVKVANSIEENSRKNQILSEISQELAECGIEMDALKIIEKITDESEKNKSLAYVSISLSKNNMFSLALETTKKISDPEDKVRALASISSDLTRMGKNKDSFILNKKVISIIRILKTKSHKSTAISELSISLVKNENWDLAERILNEIPEISKREDTWVKFAKSQIRKVGAQKAIMIKKANSNPNSSPFYIKGWSEAINVNETNQKLLQDAIAYLIQDTDSLEIVLQKYAIYEIFLGNSTPQQLQRLNQTLDIQWALDIVDSFSEKSETKDLSLN